MAEGRIELVWEQLPDGDVSSTWEAFDKAQALLFTIEQNHSDGQCELDVAVGEGVEMIGTYKGVGVAQAAAIGYLRRIDGDDFLAHGVGSRDNEVVAGADGGE